MEPTYIALIILAIIYVPIWIWVKFSPKAKEYKLSTWGPAVMIRTRWGLEMMGRLGRHKKFWRYCGIFSRIVVLFLMVYIMSILIIDLILLPNIIGRKGIGIEYALAIPGINPMLPLVYGWIALIIAMCVHELAHGIQTRANDMNVDSSGILYGVVPLGAFVEPNEEQLRKANRRAKMDVYAAGITTNFCLAMVCFILMFGMMSGVTVNHGDNVAIYGTSNVEGCDNLENTAIITDICLFGESEYTQITSVDQFYSYLDEHGCAQYSVRYLYHDNDKICQKDNVMLGVYVNKVVSDSPADKNGLKEGDFLVSMNGVHFGTNNKWSEHMKTTHKGDEVVIEYLRYDKDKSSWELHKTGSFMLSDNNGVGYLGVSTTTGGYNYTTPNALREASLNPFYGKNDIQGYAMGVFSFIGKAFQGYSPVPVATQWWYDSTVLPDNVFWIVVSLLFWIFWLNMVLGVTNALPAVPFDGGFLYAGGLDYLYEKFGVKDEKIREEKVGRIVSYTSMFMITILIFVMLVIIL